MLKKLILGLIVSSAVAILPAVGNAEILRAPHLWIVMAAGLLASILQPSYNPLTIGNRRNDRWTGSQILWTVYLTQLAAILEATYVRYPRSIEWDHVATIAAVGMVVGLAIRSWAVFTLGDLFTLHISIEEKHTVVRSGPYAFVRHPSYVGAFILFVSTTILLHAWFAAAAAVVLLVLAFVRRIRYEENMLKDEFGEAYETYSLEVKRMLPGVW